MRMYRVVLNAEDGEYVLEDGFQNENQAYNWAEKEFDNYSTDDGQWISVRAYESIPHY